jgi:biopolymer transport protein ExbD
MAINFNLRGGDNEVMVDINTAPLIDVMLVLLIMLIVTIPVQTDSVALDMAAPDAASVLQPQPVTLDIDFDGTIRWNGVTIPDRATLETDLRIAAGQEPQPEIHINPDKRVKYSFVAMVLAEAQRFGEAKIGLIDGGSTNE